MKKLIKICSLCVLATSFIAAAQAQPLVIQEQGSFAAGGTVITAPGQFDAKKPLDAAVQTYHGVHAAVFYQIPPHAHQYPIVMLHGAGQFSRTWESTLTPKPDEQLWFNQFRLRV